MQISNQKKLIPIAISIGFFISQIQSLTRFPFMHSDESWLSGLTRFMMESKSLAVTEPFFDLYPRSPHAIKSTYHILQGFFVQVFGYNLFAVRLMSLIFGCLTLILLYHFLQALEVNVKWSVLGTLLLAVQPVFIYASHFARQEIVVLFFLLLIAVAWLKSNRKVALAAAFLAMGLHPNAFLGGFALVAAGFFAAWRQPKKRRELVRSLPWLAAFTLFYILSSLWMNPNFFQDYLAYGASLGVTASAGGKINGFFLFFQKLWLGISGTYYLPPLQLTLTLILAGLVFGGTVGILKKDLTLMSLQVQQLAWGLGILIVGRYNATSIVFLVPGAVLSLVVLFSRHADRLAAQGLLAAGIACFSFLSFGEITALPENHYESYLNEIHEFVPENAIVLANLNTEFGFQAGSLYDYRNLTHLDQAGLNIAAYLHAREIEYILYADELDYLHRNPHPWQVLYGPDPAWYADLQDFLLNHCQEIADFEAPIYGNRIVQYLNDPYWHLRIYRIVK